ncbi:DUF4034 domain-containing protein [Klebsiella pneumoniae]|uniref:DUF4034 domain-containing protein n=1 Tax=Klebsiella pneumoniae TaxID=573 RepID=UPI0028BB5DE2|nr:DUF4034 domain-containing protein [Klebsiella pneumoniae]HDY8629236.1 DUF4034 domain-containing protein [Klebsiella pneumoniae]HDY8724875.1 DUF4034 domain-containing protein [Klebsiella pneumoniae]
MEQDDQLLNAMFEMCNHKNPLNDGQREWYIADIPGLLREERYDELDERYNQALTESFTSREAEKRYFLAWTQMCNHFYDMDALVEAGPEGLARIKSWQRARPRSTHAWLAEAQYWNHRAWLYRSYGWARETTRAMWICAAACNERMVIAALNAIDCEPRQWMAAALTSTNSKVFGQPDWLVEFLMGADVAGQPLMENLVEYHRHSPQEVEALMAHSGLSFADAICPNLPRPFILPEDNDDAGQNCWIAVCLAIFPTAFYVLDEYIPFHMPRWGGSHEEIREFLESSVCDHLSAAEREHLELLIWWDDHRDLSIKEVDSPDERERIIAKAEEIAQRAHIQESRHNALEWLRVCYSDLEDNDALWRTLQRSIVEKVKLRNYYTAYALKFALRDFPDTWWIYNFLCQNAQQTEHCVPKLYRGYFQYAGLFGFEKDEAQGAAWLDSVADIEYDHNWRAAIKDFRWLGYPQYLLPLAELGAQRNIPSALNQLGVESNDRDNEGLLPYDPAIAFGYFQQAAEILYQHIALRDADEYRLIANGGDDRYENDLQEIHFRMANCSERLINQAPPAEKRAVYEKNLLDNLYLASLYGDKRAWELFLLNIPGVKDLALAHSHLKLVQEEANKGTPEAMVALSQLYGNKLDKDLFDIKRSARWAHFFTTLYPEHELFMDLDALHFDSFWKRLRFTWHTFRIPDSELPGQTNAMV